MKKQIYLLAILVSSIAFSQSKERISLHLFYLPTGISIEEFQKDLDRANTIYEKNGFGVDKYKVYQVKSEDEAKVHSINTSNVNLFFIECYLIYYWF